MSHKPPHTPPGHHPQPVPTPVPPPPPPPAPPPPASGPTFPRFSPQAYCYQPIPSDAALHASSADYNATFLAQVIATGGVGCNIYQYTAPLLNPPKGTAPQAVAPTDCFNLGFEWPPGITQMWSAVPMPAFAQPSAGTDMELCLYDPYTGAYYEFWQLAHTASGWQACRGGMMTSAFANPGYWTSTGCGTMATGLCYAALQITAEELKSGSIDHVIGLAPQWTAPGAYVFPAQRTDGWVPQGTQGVQIPEGTRLRLDPTMDLSTITLHPIAKLIAKAAQTYGFIICDKTGGAPSIRFTNASSYTLIGQPDPYPALLAGSQPYQLLNNFPWDRLEFMASTGPN